LTLHEILEREQLRDVRWYKRRVQMALSMARPFKHPDTGVYYFRRTVPDDLRAMVGKREEKVSLRTKDPDEARRLHAVEAVRVDKEWSAVRKRKAALASPALPELDAETIKRIGEAYRVHLLEEDDDQRLAFHDGQSIPTTPEPTFEEYAHLSAEFEADARHAWARGGVDDFYLAEVDEVLSWEGIEINLAPNSASRRLVAHELQAAAIRAGKIKYERNNGEPIPTPDYPPPLQKAGCPSARLTSTQPLLSLLEDWWKEAQRTGLKQSTYENYRGTIQRFITFLGHDDAAKVTASDVVRFKDHRLAEGTSAKTVKDGDLAALKSIFGWGKNNLRLPVNAAEGITLKLGKPKQLRSKGFTNEEAKALLLTADNHRQRGRSLKRFSSERWVPWLCAYTGSRVGEMIQLRKQDVRKEGNLFVVHITPEAGTEKNNLARDVVLHPHLIEKGFPEFVASSRDGYLFIDPVDPARLRNTLRSRRNDVAEFARSVITDERVKPTHGWRHRHTTLWIEAGLSERVKDYIQGRPPKTVGDTYGDVTLKAQALNLERFPRQGG
jgi:integrase